MSNAFRSKSLVYRAIEDNEEDKAFVHSLLLNPQSLYQNSYYTLHQPLSRTACDRRLEAIRPSRLINVFICLPDRAEKHEDQTESDIDCRTATPIGCVNLHGLAEATRHNRTLDMGMLIAPEYRGKGYGTEAVHWILNWGFQNAGLHRIGLSSASFNTGAIRLWNRLGFHEDGRNREALWINGAWHDEVRFSILEHEWRAMTEKNRLGRNGQ